MENNKHGGEVDDEQQSVETFEGSQGKDEQNTAYHINIEKEEAKKTKILDENGKFLPIWSTPLSRFRNYGMGY